MDSYRIVGGLRYSPFIFNDEIILDSGFNPYAVPTPSWKEEYILGGDVEGGDIEEDVASDYVVYVPEETVETPLFEEVLPEESTTSDSPEVIIVEAPVEAAETTELPEQKTLVLPITELPAQRTLTFPNPEATELPEQKTLVLPNPESTTQPIVAQVMSTPMGKHVFKYNNMNVGHMQALLDEAAKYGISFRVTSGVRPGARTKSGNPSWHASGYAIDVTPIAGQTYEDLRQAVRNNPAFVKWMQDHGYGIYEETTPRVMAKTGATGKHWHIGKDKVAIRGLQEMIS